VRNSTRWQPSVTARTLVCFRLHLIATLPRGVDALALVALLVDDVEPEGSGRWNHYRHQTAVSGVAVCCACGEKRSLTNGIVRWQPGTR
jgi:hypothetical protein